MPRKIRRAILIIILINVGVLEAYSIWESVHVLNTGYLLFRLFVSNSGLRENESKDLHTRKGKLLKYNEEKTGKLY